MPQMPTRIVGGTPTTETIVKSLNSSFCWMLTKPSTASSSFFDAAVIHSLRLRSDLFANGADHQRITRQTCLKIDLQRKQFGLFGGYRLSHHLRLSGGHLQAAALIAIDFSGKRSATGHDRTHAAQQEAYSITASARTSSEGGTVRPSTLAVFMLITRSNLVASLDDRRTLRGLNAARGARTYCPNSDRGNLSDGRLQADKTAANDCARGAIASRP